MIYTVAGPPPADNRRERLLLPFAPMCFAAPNPLAAPMDASESHCETFLTEVVIMRQDVADASFAHRMHRDTICQAVTFVGACFVKGETRHECFMALWRNFDIRAAENSFSLGDCSTASLFAVLRKEIQEFNQHIFGCDQFGFRKEFAGGDGALMPLVSGIEESHKVERVDECDFHGCCLGAP